MDGLKHIEINLGKVCNNRCIFCMTYDSEKMAFAEKEKVKKEILDYAEKGYNSLGFLGGEPTIYPAILELVSYAARKGFKSIHIVSNGRRFADEKFLESLINAGATRFSVSIHSHIQEIEDGLTQVKGSFEQKINGLRNLVQLRKDGKIKENISINIVINKKNYAEIKDTLLFFNNLGINEFRLNFIRPEGRAFSHFDELVPSYSDFAAKLNDITFLIEKKGMGIYVGDVPLCILQNAGYPLNCIGELRDYLNLVVSFNDTDETGNTLKETFLWKDRRRNELKRKYTGCKSCIYDNLCEGVWKDYAKKKGFGELKPVAKKC